MKSTTSLLTAYDRLRLVPCDLALINHVVLLDCGESKMAKRNKLVLDVLHTVYMLHGASGRDK